MGHVISWCKMPIPVKVYINPPALYIPFLRISIVLFDYRKNNWQNVLVIAVGKPSARQSLETEIKRGE